MLYWCLIVDTAEGDHFNRCVLLSMFDRHCVSSSPGEGKPLGDLQPCGYRAAASRPMIERMGGELHDLWLCFGEYDIVAIAELPDNVTAAAMSMAIGSSGAMSAYRTTPLITSAEAKKAMKKAGGVGYQAPK